MTDEQLTANAKYAIDEINGRLETIACEWKYNMKVLVATLRDYAASLERGMASEDEWDGYGTAIDCKRSVVDMYDTLHGLYHEKQYLKMFLEMMDKEEEQ